MSEDKQAEGAKLTKTVRVKNITDKRQGVGYATFEPGEVKDIPDGIARNILSLSAFIEEGKEAGVVSTASTRGGVSMFFADKVRRLLHPDPKSPAWITDFNRDVFPSQTNEFDPIEPASKTFHVLFRLMQFDELNGGIQVILRIAGYLQRRGHRVTLSASRTEITNDALEGTGVDLVRGSVAADFIVGTYWTTINEIMEAPHMGRKVAFIQSDEPSWMQLGERYRALSVKAFCHPDVEYIAISKQVADSCVRNYGTDCSQWINGNGVDTLDFSPRINNFECRNAVCAIYRGAWFKNDTFVLEFMWRLKEKLPETKATMAGFKRFDSPALDTYHLDPSVDEMALFYSKSDIYLSASKIEGSPLPPLEAMACGCIPVVSGIGTEEYLVHGHNGFVIDPDDPDAALKTVLDLYADEELRQRVIRNGLATARERTWDSVGAQFETILGGLQ